MSVEPTRPPAARPAGAPTRPGRDDAADGPPGEAGLLIHITIDKPEPLTGRAAVAKRAPVPFAGWLELLRAISELIDAYGRRDDPGRPAGEEPR